MKDNTPAATAPKESAASAGLRYINDSSPGFVRRKRGRQFRYLDVDGRRIGDRKTAQRIRSLAIPPAWSDVWICPFADGHLQATGRDARGRKQYRYHPRFREVREQTKFEHVIAFAQCLPAIRKKVGDDMALSGLPGEKVIATVVYLLDKTLIRVGNGDYARHNGSYGLTTLKNRHAEVAGTEVRFHFVGKSGKQWTAKIRNRRVAHVIRACEELPGQELLQYRDEDGAIRCVTSTDVNRYLREITGKDVTAKDFRTWAGTVLAGVALSAADPFDSAAAAKRNVRAAIAQVAGRLGNTPAICRKCYIHPEILGAYMDRSLVKHMAERSRKMPRDRVSVLDPVEAAILALLRSRLGSARPANGALTLREQLRASAEMRAKPWHETHRSAQSQAM